MPGYSANKKKKAASFVEKCGSFSFSADGLHPSLPFVQPINSQRDFHNSSA